MTDELCDHSVMVELVWDALHNGERYFESNESANKKEDKKERVEGKRGKHRNAMHWYSSVDVAMAMDG